MGSGAFDTKPFEDGVEVLDDFLRGVRLGHDLRIDVEIQVARLVEERGQVRGFEERKGASLWVVGTAVLLG